jgi:hypothetical protein
MGSPSQVRLHMPTDSPPSDVFALRPPTAAGVDPLATISATGFVLGGLALVGVLGAALAVALKTELPGRWSIVLSIVLLAAWWVFVQSRGGDHDAAFGPIAGYMFIDEPGTATEDTLRFWVKRCLTIVSTLPPKA